MATSTHEVLEYERKHSIIHPSLYKHMVGRCVSDRQTLRKVHACIMHLCKFTKVGDRAWNRERERERETDEGSTVTGALSAMTGLVLQFKRCSVQCRDCF